MGETEISSFNWRNVGVKRERNHEALISRLYGSNRSIFQYLKDMVYCKFLSDCFCRPNVGKVWVRL